MKAIDILLEHLIDYAGLFPPAGLTMIDAVTKYDSYRSGRDAFALGSFVVPVSRLPEMIEAMQSLTISIPWPVSVLAGISYEEDLRLAGAASKTHPNLLTLNSIEVKAATIAAIEAIAVHRAQSPAVFVEIDPTDLTLLDAIGRNGLMAKIRTGGLTADSFPAAATVAAFIAACADRNLAFKATAGLHHPLRCVRALTYEPDAEVDTMHGFMNVFLAAALAHTGGPGDHPGVTLAEIEELLQERDPATFRIDDEAITWRDYQIDLDRLRHSRHRLARSFGSCSFEEPLGDLGELGWLH